MGTWKLQEESRTCPTLDEIKKLVTFMTNYAEKKAILLLPGRIPGYKRYNSTLTIQYNQERTYQPNTSTDLSQFYTWYTHLSSTHVYSRLQYTHACTLLMLYTRSYTGKQDVIPYSGKLSREKTFTYFVVLNPSASFLR